MPPFPKTHFWTKTNSNPTLIDQRRIELEKFFGQIVNEPVLRGYEEVKKLVRLCKQGEENRKRMSSIDLKAESTMERRSMSVGRSSPQPLKKSELKKAQARLSMIKI